MDVTDEEIAQLKQWFAKLRKAVEVQKPLHPGPPLVEFAEAIVRKVSPPPSWADIEQAIDYGEELTAEAESFSGNHRTEKWMEASMQASYASGRIEEIVSRK